MYRRFCYTCAPFRHYFWADRTERMHRDRIRNIAIIAHVDHGKTTLVDTLLKYTGAHKFEEGDVTIMDSNPL